MRSRRRFPRCGRSVWAMSTTQLFVRKRSASTPVGLVEFREIVATYFGMPSPVASALDGQVIWSKRGTERGVCDKYGEKLVSLQLSGDGWNTAHDFFKFALCEVMRDLKVGFSCEVFGLFSSLIPDPAGTSPRATRR